MKATKRGFVCLSRWGLPKARESSSRLPYSHNHIQQASWLNLAPHASALPGCATLRNQAAL